MTTPDHDGCKHKPSCGWRGMGYAGGRAGGGVARPVDPLYLRFPDHHVPEPKCGGEEGRLTGGFTDPKRPRAGRASARPLPHTTHALSCLEPWKKAPGSRIPVKALCKNRSGAEPHPCPVTAAACCRAMACRGRWSELESGERFDRAVQRLPRVCAGDARREAVFCRGELQLRGTWGHPRIAGTLSRVC